MLTQMLKGKSIMRALMNASLHTTQLTGIVLDLGSGRRYTPSYYRFLNTEKAKKIITIDIVEENLPHITANLESDFPIKDECIDSIIAFNLLEHIFNYRSFACECHRILKRGGVLYLFVPFLVRVHPDPHDYFRYTSEALSKIFGEAGFRVEIMAVGYGPFVAALSQLDGLFSFNTITRLVFTFFIAFGIFFDICLNKFTKNYKFKNWPLGYLAVCRKASES